MTFLDGWLPVRNWIVLLLFVLAGVGGHTFCAIGDRTVPLATGLSQTQWVRTVDGWEPVASLDSRPAPPELALHPFVVAAAQTMGSVLALVAFSADRLPRSEET